MKPRFFVNDAGEKEQVLISYKDYERLLEYKEFIEEKELQEDIDFISKCTDIQEIETIPAKELWNE